MSEDNYQPEENQVPDDNTPKVDDDTAPVEQPGTHEEGKAPEEEGDGTEKVFRPTHKEMAFSQQLPETRPEKPDEFKPGDAIAILRETTENVNVLFKMFESFFTEKQREEIRIRDRADAEGRAVRDDEGDLVYRKLEDGRDHQNESRVGNNALHREDSHWAQAYDHEGKTIRNGIPKQRFNAASSTQDAITYMTRAAGLGAPFDCKLPHSGVWLRFRPPSGTDIGRLLMELDGTKIALGNDTKGLGFSNTQQTITSRAVNFALRFVTDANVHFQSPEDLKDYIQVLDIPMILWGLACTMFPNGLPYEHVCVSSGPECRHVTREVLNIHNLFYDDRNTITTKQKQHLATRFHKKYSLEEIKKYQTEHAKLSSRVIWLDNLGISLRIPSLAEYEIAGMEWIEQVIDSTQGVFNEREYGQNRAAWIDMQSSLTSARQYAHWVDELFFREDDGEETSIGTDKKKINSFLDQVCSDSRYIGEFLEKVTKFMDDSTLAVIAISTYVCPKCGHVEKGTHPRFQNLVQLDALTTFFTLIRRKV